MESVTTLSQKLQLSSKRHSLFVSVTGSLVLTLAGYLALHLFGTATLRGLLASQSLPIATQEWRIVSNGLRSGWNIFPRIEEICINALNGEVLFATGQCSKATWLKAFSGTLIHAEYPPIHAYVSLSLTLWVYALVVPFLILIPFGALYFVLRKPLILKEQLRIIEIFKKLDEDSSQFSDFQRLLKAQTEEIIRLRQESVLAAMAAQVAHDIRSPLAALDSAMQAFQQLSEDKRTLVRSAIGRIRDIANNLIQENRASHVMGNIQNEMDVRQEPAPSREQICTMLLSALVDDLLTEKRMQFRSRIGITLDANLGDASYGVFANVQPIEFKRVLSNVINNSYEAMGESGRVVVGVSHDCCRAVVTIVDTGPGISKTILGRLGQRGVSFGKVDGSGLGLFHARTTVESWGGELQIESELGVGTKIRLVLPRANAPSWFVERMILSSGSIVVSFDDEVSIHEIWKGRMESVHARDSGISMIQFSTAQDLKNWVLHNPIDVERATFLMDFEIPTQKESGLDLIEALGIASQSVLVTSRFEEEILQNCLRLGVRMVPKGLAGFVPVEISNN